MKRFYKMFALSLLSLGSYSVNAQAGAYAFAASSGTYSPLTGGTDVDDIEADTQLSSAIPIGFTFNFDGVDYTDVRASSNGFLSFNVSGTSSQTGNNLDGVGATSRPLVAPLWDDHDGRATGGSAASYVVTGSAPNRVFTFEWLNWEWNYASSDPVISFQVKLYETTNVVEFVYQSESGSVNNGSASIGITGMSSFISLDGTGTSPSTSTTTESASLNTKPVTGQVYSFTPPSCISPSALLTSNLTSVSTDLDWTTGGASNWNVEYGPAGFTPGSGTMVINAAKPLNITGLTAATDYDFYVQDSCGAGDVSSWIMSSFTTSCNAITSFPWTEDFESISTPDLPTCWSVINGGTTDEFITYTTYGSAGSNAAGLYTDFNSGNNDDYLILPKFTLTGNERLIFSVRTRNTSEVEEYKVVLSTTGTNAADFSTDLMPVTTIGNTTQTPITPIDLSAYTGDVYIAIHIPNSSTDGYYIYFDDFIVEEVPACAVPSNLTVTSITDTVAVFGWTTGGAANANLEFGPAGFTPGTGTMVTNAFNPTTIDTLSPNTAYDFYVQDSCGAGDVSTWVGPMSFMTQCNVMIAPYTESFDSTFIPDCWSMSGPESWLFGGTWPGWGATNIMDHTGNGGNWAGVDGSFNNGSSNHFGVILETPLIDVTSLTVPALEFFYFSNNEDTPGDNNELEVNVWDGATWNTMRTIAEDNADWVKHTVVLGGLTITGPVKVQFVVNQTAGTAYENDQFIDDVSILEAPSCVNPYGLISAYSSMDTVVLNWSAGFQETMWNIEYGISGFTPGTGMTMTSTNTTDTITNLSLGSIYEFYIQADCGVDSSSWVGPIVVATPITNDSICDAIPLAVDGSILVSSNFGASTTIGEPSGHNSSIWYTVEVPASGHLFVETCGSAMDTKLYVYSDTTDCSDFNTLNQIAYNDDACGNQSRVEICSETPGSILWVAVSNFSSFTSQGIINISAGDLSLTGAAGQGAVEPISTCAGDTINLWSSLSNQLTNTGEWSYPLNPTAIVDDSLVNTGAFSILGNEVYYIVSNDCDADTATVVVDVKTETNTGDAISNFDVCGDQDVFLFDGLTGTIDAGGTWSDDTNTGLLNGNKFVTGGLLAGAYQFTYTVDNGVCPPASTQVTVNLVDCTNITDGESTIFGIYPNPNNGTFFINNGNNESNIVMEVIDVQGKVIYNNTYVMAAGSQQEVSLGNVESGVYLVRVVTNNQVFNSNVIVK